MSMRPIPETTARSPSTPPENRTRAESNDAVATADGGPVDSATTDGSSASDVSAACSVSGMGTVARSSGFSGTSSAYFALFDNVACVTATDCVPSCMAAGGTSDSCSVGSQCLSDICPDGGYGCLECLPPTYWLDTPEALGLPGSGANGNFANDIQAFDNGYNDSLNVTSFPIRLPAGASVRGIAFTVDRSADDDNASDQSVRVLRGGEPIGIDRGSPEPWPQTFTPMTYGGPTDTWGASWSPADVEAADFGIEITPQYLLSTGNDSVDIDSVGVTVYYGGTPGCP